MIFYGARSILVVIQAWPGCRWMHCLDRNSSSLLGVRILSLIGHGSKNRRQKPQIGLGKKWHKNNSRCITLPCLEFPNLNHAQSMNRHPLSCQISSGNMWPKQTNSIKYPCSPTFPFFQKKSPSLIPHLTHLTCTAAEFGGFMSWFLPGFLAQVEQGGPPARRFGHIWPKT